MGRGSNDIIRKEKNNRGSSREVIKSLQEGEIGDRKKVGKHRGIKRKEEERLWGRRDWKRRKSKRKSQTRGKERPGRGILDLKTEAKGSIRRVLWKTNPREKDTIKNNLQGN